MNSELSSLDTKAASDAVSVPTPTWHALPIRRRLLLHKCIIAAAFAASASASPRTHAETLSMPSPERTQQEYDRYAESYDDLDDGMTAEALGFPELRKHLLAQASGHVLELAVGTGLNLPLYDDSAVESLSAIDISSGMLRQARKRLEGLERGFRVQLQQGDVSALPHADASFDCVVDTFSLCVFPEPQRALQEAARVLKPGGRLFLLEHQRSPFAPLAWYQDIMAGAVAATGKGCYWNQDVGALVSQAGLRLASKQDSLGGLITSLAAIK